LSETNGMERLTIIFAVVTLSEVYQGIGINNVNAESTFKIKLTEIG